MNTNLPLLDIFLFTSWCTLLCWLCKLYSIKSSSVCFDDAIINNNCAHFNFIHILINITWQWLSLIEWKSLITWGMFVNVSLIMCLYAHWITAHAPPLLESYSSPLEFVFQYAHHDNPVCRPQSLSNSSSPPQHIFLRKAWCD